MKEEISDKLKLLAKSQEYLIEITEMMNQWNTSQLFLEKTMFDSLNNSDRVLNLSREGRQLSAKLLECCNNLNDKTDSNVVHILREIAEETEQIYTNLVSASKKANEIAHNLEEQISCQRQASENIEDSLEYISDSVDQAAACAEFLLSELYT